MAELPRAGTLGRNRSDTVRATAASANLAITTDKLRDHLGSNGGASAANPGPLMRDTGHSAAGGTPDDQLTEEQLVRKAQAIHKDTTATAEQALRLVEESKQVKNATLKELDNQNRKLEQLNDDMHRMNETLTYSEKLLRYMRRCCCCWMFDSCTGADPEGRREAQWQEITSKNEYANDMYASPSPRAQRSAAKPRTPRSGDGPQFRNPDTNLGKGHEAAAMKLAAETEKQNQMLDQIEKGLDELLDGAQEIGNAVDEQDRRINKLQKKADRTEDRVAQMNSKSQLRKYGKKKENF